MKKSKRLAVFLLAHVMLMTLMSGITLTVSASGTYSGGTGTENDPFILSDADDLLAFHAAVSGDDGSLDAADECGLGMYHGYYFKLGNDIDMSGVEWTPVSFCGNLDGNGFAVKNLSVKETDNGDGEYWAAMFAQMINASVSNITFDNCDISVSAETSSGRDIYAAVVAANVIASKLENIKVVNSSVVQNGYAKNFGYAAPVAAITDISNITGCVVDKSTVSVNVATASSMKVGGITGCFEDTFYEFISDYGNPYNMSIGAGSDYGIYDCYVNADLSVSAGKSSHVSGIAGMTCTDYLDNLSERNGVAVEVKNCVFKGTITAADNNASGITGWDEPEDCIIDCVSMATISAPTVFALAELPETITNSFYLADETDETGGRTMLQFESGDVCNERGKHFNAGGACVICGEAETHMLEFDLSKNITASYTVDGGDAVSDLSAAEIAENSVVEVTFIPESGYYVKTVTFDDSEIPVVDNKVSIKITKAGVLKAVAAEAVLTVPSILSSEVKTVPSYTFKDASGRSAVMFVKIDKGYGYSISESGSILTANGNLFRLPFDGNETVFGVRVVSPAFEIGESYSMKAYISGDFDEVQSEDKTFSFEE